MNKKQILALAIVVTLIGGLVAAGCSAPAPAPAKTYDWRLGQTMPDPENVRYRGAELFIKLVEEKSNGRMKITHYPGDLLGDWTVQSELTSEGSLDFNQDPLFTGLDERANVQYINYMFYNNEGAREAAMFPDGWLAKMIDPIAIDCNVKILNATHNGWVGLHMTPDHLPRLDTVDNWFTDTGKMKIRCEPSKVMEQLTEAMGFKAVILPFSEVYSALQLGTIDGWVGSSIDRAVQYSDVIKYRIEIRNRINIELLMCNLDLWKSLSAEDQKILEEAGLEAQDWMWDFIESEEQAWFDRAEEANVEVVAPSSAVLRELVERDRNIGWNSAEELIGKEMMDEIRSRCQPLPE